MLICEGFRMLFGTARIKPVNGLPAFEVRGTMLYRPDYDTWYINGSSYPADIFEVVEDLT